MKKYFRQMLFVIILTLPFFLPSQEAYANGILTTAKSGWGQVSGTGINCGIDCTENFTSNAIVTLQATPLPGFAFSGWSGGCTGTGTCVVTMTADTTVTATFTPPATPVISVISAGSLHTAALMSDGTLWTWGSNQFGQLGNGKNTDSSIPVKIGIDTDWVSVSANGESNIALKTDGTIWAWGYNQYGQLGNGNNTNSNIPVKIGTDTNWTYVSAGGSTNIAIKADGTIWTWGWNLYGQLGNGNNTNSNIPIKLGTDTNWIAASTSGAHTMALKTDNTLWAWGSNSNGQLGNGNTTDINVPVQIGTSSWLAISTGGPRTVGIKTDGTLWAWGWNHYGQLGDGTFFDSSIPLQLGTDTNWSAVSAHIYHTLAIKTDGTLWSWGYNLHGNIGDGSLMDSSAPKLISAATDWASIATGWFSSFALKPDGSHWTWGANANGQLGDGTVVEKWLPGKRRMTPAVTPFTETYDSAVIPAGWNLVNAGSGDWKFSTSLNTTGGTGGFATVGTYTWNAELRTPVIDMSGAVNPILEFKSDYTGSADTLAVDISTDNGVTWTNVWTRKAAGPFIATTFQKDITAAVAANKSNVMVRFHYLNGDSSSGDWSIDDVKIYSSCSALDKLQVNAPFTASIGSIAVTSTCYWTAASNVPWVTIDSGTGGTGSGTVNISITAGPDLFGTIDIAGQTVMVKRVGIGGLDPFFTPNPGVYSTSTTGNSSFDAVARQSDGKLLALGTATTGAGDDISVLRFNVDGSVDTSFAGGAGKILWDSGASTADYGVAIAVQPDDNIVVLGGTRPAATGQMALIRYDKNGILETTFGAGTGAITYTPDSAYHFFPEAIAIQPDGKLLVAATSWSIPYKQTRIVRFNVDGTLDSGTGGFNGGLGSISFNAGSTSEDVYAKTVHCLTDGNILFGGKIVGARQVGYVARLLSNGSLDPAFNGTGYNMVSPVVTAAANYTVDAIDIQSSGSIIASGNHYNSTTYLSSVYAVRLDTAGVLDANFGTNGVVTHTPPTGGTPYHSQGMVLQDDRIAIVGRYTPVTGNDEAVTLLLDAAGALDTSFGSGGVTMLSTPGSSGNASFSLLQQPDGNLVSVGFAGEAVSNKGFLMRQTVQPAGLVSWWKGDNNAIDLIGGNNGTLLNGATYTTGIKGQSFSFDGISAGFQAPGTGLPSGSADRTLSLWVNINQAATNESAFAGYGIAATGQMYAVGALNNNTLYFSNWGGAIFGPVLQNNRWYHVAVTNVGNNQSLYLNGTLVATGNLALSTSAGNYFGGYIDPSRKLNGSVDEIQVYNRALTAAEIQTLSNGVDTIPPSDGTLNASVISSNHIDLSWTAATDTGSGLSTINPYKVVRADGTSIAPPDCTSGTPVYSGNALYFYDYSLSPNTPYAYRVCAIDASGNVSVGVTATATTVPLAAPLVTSTTPATGGVLEDITSEVITATFNVLIDFTTVNATTFIVKDQNGAPVAGSLTYDGYSSIVTFTPASFLSGGATYTVTVTSGVKNASGAAMAADYSWNFTVTPYLGGVPSEGNLLVTPLSDGRIGVYRYITGTWQEQVFSWDSKGSRLQVAGTGYTLGYFGTGTAPTGIANSPVGSNQIRTEWLTPDGIRIVQELTYQPGAVYYGLTWKIANESTTDKTDLRFFHGEDTYFNGSDTGAGFWDAPNNTIGVQRTIVDVGLRRMSLQAVSTPFAYDSENYSTVNTNVESGALTNTIDSLETTDNGYALEWRNALLQPNTTWSISAFEKFADVTVGAVSVTAPVTTTCQAGTNCSIMFTLTNSTASPATVNLSLIPDQTGWTATTASTSLVVAAGSSQQVLIQLAIPAGTATGFTGKLTVAANDGTVTASDSVAIKVTAAVPVITWANPSPITYGTALSATQLNAAASVPGTFVYTPASGTIPAVGTQTLSVIFTPNDTTNYTTGTQSVTLLVNPLPVNQITTGPDGKTTVPITIKTGGATLALQAGTLLLDSTGTPISGTLTLTASVMNSAAALPTGLASAPTNDGLVLTSLGNSIDITISTGTSHVKTITPPMTVTLTIPSTFAAPGGAVSYYSFNGTTWTLEGSTAVKADGTADMQTGHLSVWALATFTAPLDSIAPQMSTFNAPATSPTLNITGITLTATDAVGVTGYMINENATAPLATDSGWTTTPPATITLHTWGYHKLYAYAKDAAGNVSLPLSASVVIAASDITDGVILPAPVGAPVKTEPQLTDALKSLNFAMKIEIPTPVEILHGDVAPLINGVPHPDGVINLGDTIVILRRVVGL